MSRPLCGEPAQWGMPSSPATRVEAFSVVKELPASVFSRGAATECSPGRKPGGSCRLQRSPGGAKDSEDSFAPSGAEIVSKENPGLTPGATLCRRSAAVHSLFWTALPLQGGESAVHPAVSLHSEGRTEAAHVTQFLERVHSLDDGLGPLGADDR